MEPERIAESILEDRSSENLRGIGNRLKKENADLGEYLDLLWEEHPIGMRFTWLMGGLCERAPEMIAPHLPRLFTAKEELNFPGYDRSLAKWMSLCGIPEEIEGEVADQLFEWMLDPQIKVAVKAFSMTALANLSRKYPELGTELRLIIEEQFEEGSAGYKSRGRKVLAQLDRISPRRD